MTSENHQPGPWNVERRTDSGSTLTDYGLEWDASHWIEVVAADGELVISLCEEDIGDARLIAAAPEMLEALEKVLQEVKHKPWVSREAERISFIVETIEPIIKKAKSGT